MRDRVNKFPIGWIVVLAIVVLAGAMPAVWAGPLAEPARQTVPTATPVITTAPAATAVPGATAVPSPTVGLDVGADIGVLQPGQSEIITIIVLNETGEIREGCIIRFEDVPEGIELLVGGEIVTAPYVIDVPTIEAGGTYEFDLEVRMVEGTSSIAPCTTYTVKAMLECGDEVTLLQEIVLSTPCPVLPDVGK